MKIYTKGGDQGQTSLASGERVAKCDERVILYGETDELNSCLGFSLTLLPENCNELSMEIQQAQNLLFELASELAGYEKIKQHGAIQTSDLEILESAIDRMQVELKPLKNFILPGGHPAAASLHVARTICRRLERQMVLSHAKANQLPARSNVSSIALQFMNRLSDYLFVAARYTNHINNIKDIAWKSRL